MAKYDNLNELITYLSEKGELPSEFLRIHKTLLIYFSQLLHDEDASVSAESYLTDLVSKEKAKIKAHSGFESELKIVSTKTNTIVKNVKDAILKGDSLKLIGANKQDPGSLTNFGISFKHILANKGNLSTKLMKAGLLVPFGNFSNAGIKDSFYVVDSAKVSLMYFLLQIVKRDYNIPKSISDKDILKMTLRHLGFTSYYGFFTLMRSKTDPLVSKRPFDGLNRTRVYPSDVDYVLNMYSVAYLLDKLEQIDPALFGRHLGQRRVKANEGRAYKNRFVRILRRL